jgi:UDP-glucose 4-epimerase
VVSRRRIVAVTGVAGFIGSRLAARLLAEGAEVIGIDDLSAGARESVPAGVEFVRQDVRECSPELLRGADAVAHLAAKNCLPDCEADPETTWDINVEGTRRVFRSAIEAGVRRFLLASSSATYEGVLQRPTREGVRLLANSAYGRSKVAAEVAVGEGSGIAVDVLRYFNVYGPGQDYRRSQPPVISSFIMAGLLDRSPVVFGTGETRRDYVHVDDVNDLQATRLLGDAAPMVMNVGSGGTTSVLEVLEAVAAELGQLRPVVRHPATRRDSVETWADITRARSTGWSPGRSLKQGIRETADYLREIRRRGLLGP